MFPLARRVCQDAAGLGPLVRRAAVARPNRLIIDQVRRSGKPLFQTLPIFFRRVAEGTAVKRHKHLSRDWLRRSLGPRACIIAARSGDITAAAAMTSLRDQLQTTFPDENSSTLRRVNVDNG